MIIRLLGTFGLIMLIQGCGPKTMDESLKTAFIEGNSDYYQNYLENNPEALNGTTLTGLSFKNLRLENIDISHINWTDLDLTGAEFKNIHFSNGTFSGVNFNLTRMENVTFSKVTLQPFEDKNQDKKTIKQTQFTNSLYDSLVYPWDIMLTHENNHGRRIRGAELINVTFTDSHFIGALMGDSYYEHVNFISVTMEPFEYTSTYQNEIYRTRFINSAFNQVTIGKDSTLTDTQLNYLSPGSQLSITQSQLTTDKPKFNHIFWSSNFSKLLIDHCKINYNSFGEIDGNGEIIIRNSKLSNITSNGIHADTVRLENNVAYAFRLSGWINKILARNNKIYGKLSARIPTNSKISTILSSGNTIPAAEALRLYNASLIVIENDIGPRKTFN